MPLINSHRTLYSITTRISSVGTELYDIERQMCCVVASYRWRHEGLHFPQRYGKRPPYSSVCPRIRAPVSAHYLSPVQTFKVQDSQYFWTLGWSNLFLSAIPALTGKGWSRSNTDKADLQSAQRTPDSRSITIPT